MLGLLIDGAVGILALFFPSLMGPLLDVPALDPAAMAIAGGEFIVVALVYLLVLRDIERFRPLLWVLALDQAFAAILTAVEIALGHVPGTWKTIGPLPLSLALALIYVAGARARNPRT